MPNQTKAGTLFKPELVQEMFNKVNGHSALAKLCNMTPMPFAGTETFVFTMDGEASIVGEGANKPSGEAEIKSITIQPIKFVYQHRITDEFDYLSNEKKLPYLMQFSDGFAKKIARAFDISAIHGLNPADKQESSIVGNNCFTKSVTKEITVSTKSPINPDDAIDKASKLVTDSHGVINGIAMSPEFGSSIGSMKTPDSNLPIFPEFRFGANPAAFCGIPSDVNSTVAFNSSQINAIVGDFQNAFKWGYAENIPLEIIRYGNPDGLGDLKHMNQIVLRAEAFIGWGILDPKSFALIKASE